MSKLELGVKRSYISSFNLTDMLILKDYFSLECSSLADTILLLYACLSERSMLLRIIIIIYWLESNTCSL